MHRLSDISRLRLEAAARRGDTPGMSATSPNPASRPVHVGEGGAWLGLGVAVRAALAVAGSVLPLLAVSGLWIVIDQVDRGVAREGGWSAVPPEASQFVDLLVQAGEILRTYALAMGLSGAALGLLLFLFAVGLQRGSDFSRRVVRVLLAADALHTFAGGVWVVLLTIRDLGPWMQRYQAAVARLVEMSGRGQMKFPMPGLMMPATIQAIPQVAVTLVSGAMALGLLWLAGRPFVRDWCAARSSKSPVAVGRLPG